MEWFWNTIICCFYHKWATEHRAAMKNPQQAQEKLLLEILHKNKNTLYGKKFGFSHISNSSQYRQMVPLTTYEDYLPYLKKMANGKEAVLTSEKILLFELTSGSSSAKKLIPYTKSLKEQFQYGIRPWLYDLYCHYPSVKRGKSYWSITPAVNQKKVTSCGIPIGFEKDSEYFGFLEKYIMEKVFVCVKGLEEERNIEKFYQKTCLALLETKNLSLISVWNPTFLFLLLDYIQKNKKLLFYQLSEKRKKEIRKHLVEGNFSHIWPHLALISCWCDMAAKQEKQKLQKIFPHTLIQPKGLLATEGFISFPLIGQKGSCLSVLSHFFEFRNIADRLFYSIGELKKGEVYEIILTTGGGFYRYCIKDTIKVIGYEKNTQCPMIEFCGRLHTSDLFGEKLEESFVQKVLSPYLEGSFFLLAPKKDHYVLYTSKQFSFSWQQKLDKQLQRGFHYEYCRKLGQLKCLRIFCLTGNPEQEYLKACTQRGQKLGDIKKTVFSQWQNWDKVLEGYYLTDNGK